MKYQSREYWAGLIKMSLSRFFILHVLHNEPLHGYEIAKRVADITCGCCAPTEGGLYPVLKEFVDNGLVNLDSQIVAGRERKTYTITAAGEIAYQVASQAWCEVSAYILRAVNHDNS